MQDAVDALKAELPELPGIDTERGLITTQHNIALYRKLLHRFHDSQQDFEQQFRTAQADTDPQAATPDELFSEVGTDKTIGSRHEHFLIRQVQDSYLPPVGVPGN